MNLNFNDEEHAGQRLRNWLSYQMDALGVTPEDLAQDLGYERASTVRLWLEGKSKIPLRLLPKLAKMLVVDPAPLICLFLDQEFSDEPELREEMVAISSRVVPEWEYPLILAARLVYISGEESLWTWLPDYAA